jgi:hypothetical protein
LQRINAQAISGINGKYSYDQTASSVDAYIIDTYVFSFNLQMDWIQRLMWGDVGAS